jgi:hypothetical protein
VSVAPAAGKVEIVIDLRGAVEVQDFTLGSPARLVVDLLGARLGAPVTLYDGQNRGGVKNVRYGQFRPTVVRVVIDLDALKDYEIQRVDGQIRIQIGTERTAFGAWSSSTPANAPEPVAAAPASAPRVTGDTTTSCITAPKRCNPKPRASRSSGTTPTSRTWWRGSPPSAAAPSS